MGERFFWERLHTLEAEGKLPSSLVAILRQFFSSYAEALKQNNEDVETYAKIFGLYLEFIVEQVKSPYQFEPYHACMLSPVNYYAFGLDLIRPLVQFSKCKRLHLELVDQMAGQLKEKHNVVLLANHQTEPDPQAISLLLEDSHKDFARDMIFVAGHRVVTDPLAIPFSMGRNLLCIFSKKYLEMEPDLKAEKLLHNQRTMKKMAQLFAEGGKCIYVAPSGGRDRKDPSGAIQVAPFDPQSIEMFWLMAQSSGKPTHFYPLALNTFDLLPPPNSIEQELGEKRHAQATPIHLAFGEELDMETFPGSDVADRKERRQNRANHIWNIVVNLYQEII